MSVLLSLIEQDYTLTGHGRYLKTLEHDSLVIDTTRDLFFWNSREINGDAYVWLVKIKGMSPMEARRKLRELKTIDNRVYVSVDTPSGEEIVVYPKLVQVFWENGKRHRDYWYARGISDQTVDRFQLGYSEGWYTIPFFIDNSFVNFQMRRDSPEKRVKSWYRGLGPMLWNRDLLKTSSSVIITESPTDAILLRQHGYPAVSHNAGAGFWISSWNKYFIDQKNIYIIYDNDEAGRLGASTVAEALGVYRCKIYTFDGYEEKYDLGMWFLDNIGSERKLGELITTEAKHNFEA